MEGSQGSDRHLVVIQILPRNALNFLGVNSVDAQDHFGGWNVAPISEDLRAEVGARRRRRAASAEKCGLQFALAARHFLVSDGEGKQVNAKHQLADAVLYGDLVASGVEAEHSRVLVAEVEGLELLGATDAHLVGHGVRGAVPRDGPRHEAGAPLVAADDVLHHHERDGVGAPVGHAFPADSHICRRAHLVVAVDQLGAAEVWFRVACTRCVCTEPAERGGGKLHELVVFHGASGCQHHLVRCVIGIHVAPQLLLCHRLHPLEGPERRETKRAVAKGAGVEAVVQNRARRRLGLLEAPQRRRLFLREAGQAGAGHEVGEDVDAFLDVRGL
mmetsp:Transcript_121189/g.342920  ORF Transcript_121189/g.342920 Transcript_121189/m.342920 type:complete len:330 (-) Transcript_121189:462-1451(-)